MDVIKEVCSAKYGGFARSRQVFLASFSKFMKKVNNLRRVVHRVRALNLSQLRNL